LLCADDKPEAKSEESFDFASFVFAQSSTPAKSSQFVPYNRV
jgi:hypothetical protein